MKNTIIATGLLLAAVLTGCHGVGHFRPPQPTPYQTVSMEFHEPRQSPANHDIPYSFGHAHPGSRMYYSYLWQGYRGFVVEHDIYGMRRHSRLSGVEDSYHASSYASEGTVEEFVNEDEMYSQDEMYSEDGMYSENDAVNPDEFGDDDEAIPSAPIVEPTPVGAPLLAPVPEDEGPSVETSTDAGSVGEESPVWEFSPRPPLVHPAPARPSLPAEQHRYRIPRNDVPAPADASSDPQHPRIPRNSVPAPGNSDSERQQSRIPRNSVPVQDSSLSELQQNRIPRNSVPTPVNSPDDRIPRNQLPR